MYKHSEICMSNQPQHCDCGAIAMNLAEASREQNENDRSVKNPLVQMQDYLENDLKLKPPYIDSIMLKLSEVLEESK